MEAFLLNPNAAYLFLVTGFFLALMAVLVPGTGLLEVGAVFALLLAGYAVYNLPVNAWALVVLAIGVMPFILAVRRSGKMGYLIISIATLGLGSAYLFRSDAWWKPAVNPLLALVVSILVGVFLWVATRKTLEAEARKPVHDLDQLVGAIGEAKTAVSVEGSVQVLGEMWSAHSSQPIQAGNSVRVVRREGLMLEVEVVE